MNAPRHKGSAEKPYVALDVLSFVTLLSLTEAFTQERYRCRCSIGSSLASPRLARDGS